MTEAEGCTPCAWGCILCLRVGGLGAPGGGHQRELKPMFPWEENITAPLYTEARQPAKDRREKWLWGTCLLLELGVGGSLPLGKEAHRK